MGPSARALAAPALGQWGARAQFSRALRLSCAVWLLLVVSPIAAAWHTLTHPLIVERAYQALPADIQQAFHASLDDVKHGSVTPDLLGDWANHELDLHPSTDFSLPVSVLNLQQTAAEVVEALNRGSPDAAERLGALFHYVQDHLHPLHTGNDPRETDALHRAQEQHTYARRGELPEFADPGIRYWHDLLGWAETAIPRTNRLYRPWVEMAVADEDSFPLARRAFNQAVTDTRDLWVSLWYRAFPDQARMHLQVNRTELQPGQQVGVRLSRPDALPAEDLNAPAESLLELRWTRLTDAAVLKTETVSLLNNQAQAAAPEIEGEYWLTAQQQDQIDQVVVKVARRPFFELSSLNPAGYVLDARWPHTPRWFRQYVRPWDFIAVGGCTDDPSTEAAEGFYSAFIPGDFDHVSVYLGRDAAGRPIAMELTNEIWPEDAPQFRVSVLPEGTADEAPDRLGAPQFEASLRHCAWRWSRPLQPADRDAVEAAADDLLALVQRHWEQGFRYQLPFHWSRKLGDTSVRLVDDGFQDGADCADYWVTAFEQLAGVCLTGTRMSAADVMDYFSTAPFDLADAELGASGSNLLPLLANGLLLFGWEVIDAPPHRFLCDGSEETGIVLPSRLILSPDLGPPEFLPTAAVLPRPGPGWSLLSGLYQLLKREFGASPGEATRSPP